MASIPIGLFDPLMRPTKYVKSSGGIVAGGNRFSEGNSAGLILRMVNSKWQTAKTIATTNLVTVYTCACGPGPIFVVGGSVASLTETFERFIYTSNDGGATWKQTWGRLVLCLGLGR
jgi:hypothetical protein